MPFVTLTTSKATPQTVIDGLLEAAHAALIAIGVPPADRFQRVLQLAPSALKADPTYPDLKQPRSAQFVLIEVTLSVGRPLKLKRQFAESVVAAAQNLGISGED